MRFLVCSAPRSGTLYAATVFTKLGLPCQHEIVFDPEGQHGWTDEFPGESSWLAAPYIASLPDDIMIFHQYRNRNDAARSLIRHDFFYPDDAYRAWAEQHLKPRRSNSSVRTAANFIDRWHDLISRQAARRPVFSYHVERIDADLLLKLCAAVGHKPTKTKLNAALRVPRNTHTNERPEE